MKFRKLHCPRCKTEVIVDYGETFDCPICFLEFEKKDFDLFKDDSIILSIDEKLGVLEVLKEKSYK